VHHSQIERSEVLVKWEVCQIVVDIEKEGILEVLRRTCITHPVQFILNNLDWSAKNLGSTGWLIALVVLCTGACSWLLERTGDRTAISMTSFRWASSLWALIVFS